MVLCFAPTCRHYSETHDCKWFSFPKNESDLLKWTKLIRRKDRKPGNFSRICSCHFIDGDMDNGPTIFSHNVGELLIEPPSVIKDRVKRMRSSLVEAEKSTNQPIPQLPMDITPFQRIETLQIHGVAETNKIENTFRIVDSDEKHITQPVPQSVKCEPHENIETTQTQRVPEPYNIQKTFSAVDSIENYYLKQENQRLKEELEKLSMSFSFKHIEENNNLISFYTGLPSKEVFLNLFSLFENMDLIYERKWQVTNVPKIDQLLITLMKLRLNLFNEDLACRFNTSKVSIINIFRTWLSALHEVLFKQFMAKIPSLDKNKTSLPSWFDSVTNCRLLIDCTEMATIHYKNQYRNIDNMKGLVGISPNGVVTFASKLYPGYISDVDITEDCGILSQLKTGDLIITLKCLSISKLLPPGVTVNIPPEFSEEQENFSNTMRKARLNLRQVRGRIKSFKILEMFPYNLMTYSSMVFQVCVALTNLQQFPTKCSEEDV